MSRRYRISVGARRVYFSSFVVGIGPYLKEKIEDEQVPILEIVLAVVALTTLSQKMK